MYKQRLESNGMRVYETPAHSTRELSVGSDCKLPTERVYRPFVVVVYVWRARCHYDKGSQLNFFSSFLF